MNIGMPKIQNRGIEEELRTRARELEGLLEVAEQNVILLQRENDHLREESQTFERLASNWEKDNGDIREDNRILRERIRELKAAGIGKGSNKVCSTGLVLRSLRLNMTCRLLQLLLGKRRSSSPRPMVVRPRHRWQDFES